MREEKKSFYLKVLLPGLLIPLVVAVLFSFPRLLSLGDWVYALPAVHALINGTTACMLIFAIWAIKSGNLRLHKRLMSICVVLGALFLLSYLLYHGSVASTIYGDSNGDFLLSDAERAMVGDKRKVYLLLLASHIILSIPVVFCVLMMLHYLRIHNFKKHKALGRYVFPIWWYVSASGVAVYLMIRPFYT